MPVNPLVNLVQHHRLVVQLVADLYRQVPLARDGHAEPVELVVLLLQYGGVVGVDLLVCECALVGGVGRVFVGVVRGEEGFAVGEADAFRGFGGGLGLLRVSEVGCQGGVVWRC